MRSKCKQITTELCMLLLIILVAFRFHFLLFEEKYIQYVEKLTKIPIPETASLVDCKVNVSSYGIVPFYAKLTIDQDTFDLWDNKSTLDFQSEKSLAAV